MAIGVQHTIKIKEDPDTGVLSLVSLQVAEFNHDGTFVATATSAVKEDFAGSPNDTFTVKVAYPNGSAPASSTTLATLVATAKTAVNTLIGSGEAAS